MSYIHTSISKFNLNRPKFDPNGFRSRGFGSNPTHCHPKTSFLRPFSWNLSLPSDRKWLVIVCFVIEMEAETSRKSSVTNLLQAVKRKSGKSFNQIAEETGLTNVYVAQLLRRQAQLKPETAPKLRAALPELSDELIREMMIPPMRSYHPNLIQEPTVYRFGLIYFSVTSLKCFWL